METGQKEIASWAFFICEFQNLNLVPIDSELNSAPGNQTHFLFS